MKLFLAFALALSACGLFVRDRYITVEKPVACLKEPPVQLHPWGSHGPAEGCPAPWDQCLKKDEAQALEWSWQQLVDRVRDDWMRCGVKP